MVVPAVVTGSPARIAASRATLCPVAPSGNPHPMDHVLDFAGLEPRPLDGLRDGVPGQDGAVRLVEGAPERFSDRCSGGGDDDGV